MASGQLIQTQVDIEEVEKALAGTNKSLKAIRKSVLRIAAKETAKRWHCTPRWVSSRCREGMIPSASLIARRWDIPEDAEEPPCAIGRAATILENILELQAGNEVFVYSPATKEASTKIIGYLSREGFISAIKSTENIDEELSRIRVLNRGVNLIARARKKTAEEVEQRIKVTGELNIGVAKTSIEYEKKKKR